MNTKKIFIGLMALTLSMQSCREEYLNEPRPLSALTPDKVYSSLDNARSHIAGILRFSRNYHSGAETANIASMYYARSVKGTDISLPTTAWFSGDYQYINRFANSDRPDFTWDLLYSLIRETNAFITGMTESTKITDSDKRPLLAQAYTMRAWYYFELSQEFQQTYALDPSAFAPPIYTQSGLREGKPLSTQKEMYDFILSDIEKALEYGTTERIDKSYYNKTVTYALATRVYQVLAGNTNNTTYWNKVKEYANLAYGGSVENALDASSYGSGFDEMKNTEWILALPQTEDQSITWAMPPYGFLGAEWYDGWIAENLVGKFSNTDVRRLFYEDLGNQGKFRTSKFKYSNSADVALVRTPEMILAEAEAYYHLGNETSAHNLLYQLQVNRDPSAVKSSNTGNALLEEILLERRKELYGEIGVEWFDAKRLQRGIKRDNTHSVTIDIAPNDKRFYMQIPQAEIDANKNISKTINVGR